MNSDVSQLLAQLDPTSLTYEEWLKVGMALHYEGASVEEWDAWSARDAKRYVAGDCAKRWAGFRGGNGRPVTIATVCKLVKDRGGVPPGRGRADGEIPWDGPICEPDEARGRHGQPPDEDPAALLADPPLDQYDGKADLMRYLQALFQPTDHVSYVTESRWDEKKGKWIPRGAGAFDRTAGQLLEALATASDLGAVTGDWRPEAGAWIRFNPLDGQYIRDTNVTAYRCALVEGDEQPVEDQLRHIRELRLPVVALVSSGGKSVHAIVRVDARDHDEYRARVATLYQVCTAAGFRVCGNNKNPSRLSRLPGATRNGRPQRLLATGMGCASWDEWLKTLEPTEAPCPPAAATEADEKPIVYLPDNSAPVPVRITDAATQLGGLLAARQEVFCRAGTIVRVEMDREGRAAIRDVSAASLQSELETVARLATTRKTKEDGAEVAVVKLVSATKAQAEAIAAARAFGLALPQLKLLTPCAALVRRANGALATVCGYDAETGIYASGGDVPQVPLDEAVAMLSDAVSGFRFATEGDHSRAVAALITPALVHGGLLAGRAPVELGEANESQSGKGYRARLTAAIYRDSPAVVTQRKQGVGGLEETFSAALLSGRTFVSLDNIRGGLDSPGIESALTEDRFMARAPYRAPTEIDMHRVVVMLTSNGAELTVDLANRASPVRILKQPEGYQFKTYEGGRDLLAHVVANQPLYLGAVFAVVRAWFEAGCPRTAETRHDFRAWAQPLDWIVQNLFHLAPLCDGLKETKVRMTSPVLSWLRMAALALVDAGLADRWLRTSAIVDALEERGCQVPGTEDGGDLSDPAVASRVHQATGRRLSQCFRHAGKRTEGGHEIETLTIDGMVIMRRDEYCPRVEKTVKVYAVRPPSSPRVGDPPMAATGHQAAIGGKAQASAAASSPVDAIPPMQAAKTAYAPPMGDLIPPIPPNVPNNDPGAGGSPPEGPLQPVSESSGEVRGTSGGIGGIGGARRSGGQGGVTAPGRARETRGPSIPAPGEDPAYDRWLQDGSTVTDTTTTPETEF